MILQHAEGLQHSVEPQHHIPTLPIALCRHSSDAPRKDRGKKFSVKSNRWWKIPIFLKRLGLEALKKSGSL